MGTRGLYSYRYRRRYLTRYNHMDSYLDGLGSKLRGRIPRNPKDIKAWIEREGKRLEKRFKQKAAGDVHNDEGRVSWDPPELDLFIEYAYVIDLDRCIFSVNGHETEGWVHLAFDQLPDGDEWMEAVEDSAHPAHMDLSKIIPPADAADVAVYTAANTEGGLVLPSMGASEPAREPSTTDLFLEWLFRVYRIGNERVLRSLGFEHNNPTVVAAIVGALAVAAFGDIRFVQLVQLANSKDRLIRHDEAFLRGRSPEDGTYSSPIWYHNTLIVISPGLEVDAEHLHAGVGRAIAVWRSTTYKLKSSRAFVVSPQSLVTVDFSEDGKVRHSEPFEFLQPREYSKADFSFAECATPFAKGFKLLREHFTPDLPPPPGFAQNLKLNMDVINTVLDFCEPDTLDAVALTCKHLRQSLIHRPRIALGDNWRLLHHVPGTADTFTAINLGSSEEVQIRLLGLAKKAPRDARYGALLHMPALNARSKAQWAFERRLDIVVESVDAQPKDTKQSDESE